jgi:hypothetical protein
MQEYGIDQEITWKIVLFVQIMCLVNGAGIYKH